MNKYNQNLFEEQFMCKMIAVTELVCEEQFDEEFKKACEKCDENDTTLGTAFRRLQKIAIKEVRKYIHSFENGVDISIACSSTNPFNHIIKCLFRRFTDEINVSLYVQATIEELWNEKFNELFKLGIVDKEHMLVKTEPK